MNNNKFICPCGGGQLCIVDRRKNKDYVHEDCLFKDNKLPLRKHCLQLYYNSQLNVLLTN